MQNQNSDFTTFLKIINQVIKIKFLLPKIIKPSIYNKIINTNNDKTKSQANNSEGFEAKIRSVQTLQQIYQL